MIYQVREQAYQDQDTSQRSKVGTSYEFMQRDNALMEQDKTEEVKNATTKEFFKQDEAVRGDISDGKSVYGNSQAYYNNIERASQGRPDTYSQSRQGVPSEYINKSDLERDQTRNAQGGLATPIPDAHADPIDYMNKSDAEYGRAATV